MKYELRLDSNQRLVFINPENNQELYLRNILKYSPNMQVVIRGKIYDAKIKEFEDTYYDHGKEFKSSELDIVISLPCPILGSYEVSCLRVLKKTRLKIKTVNLS